MLMTNSQVHPAESGRAAKPWSASARSDLQKLAAREGCRYSEGEPMARHTSMGVGGPATVMLWPQRPASVRHIIAWLAVRGLPWRCLGGGSNLLVADKGVAEAVIALSSLLEGARIDASQQQADLPAGMPTAQALRHTATEGLDGLVWAAGLPGTIGGAAAGNAGCWGGEMSEVVDRLQVITGAGKARELSGSELGWSYRQLRMPATVTSAGAAEREESIVVGGDAGRGDTHVAIVRVHIRLQSADAQELVARYEKLQATKRRRQPMGARNSGCIFRNPDAPTEASRSGSELDGEPSARQPREPERRSAGQLIDQAGCKGLREGDAQVSEQHANFIVNLGKATMHDVELLIQRVRTRVRERFEIELSTEIRQW